MANKHRYKPEIERLFADGQHWTADDVYDQLKKIYYVLGKGTVYRSLQELVDEWILMKTPGLIDKILFEKTKPPHGHLVCKLSGMVVDVMMDQISFANLDLPEGFEPEQAHVRVDGHFTSEKCVVDARILNEKLL